MSDRTASLLCYLPWVGWIVAIVILVSESFRRRDRARFHAFQGLYLFVAWLLVDWIMVPAMHMTEGGFIFPFPAVLAHAAQVLILVAWIVMIIKASRGEDYHLPLLGELAERSVREQRMV